MSDTERDSVQHVTATCHCGAIEITLAAKPEQVTHCNCSLCRRYGVLWAYYAKSDVQLPEMSATDTYAWGDKNIDFHRCASCGCITHWQPRDPARNRVGINARLLNPDVLSIAKIRYKDYGGTGIFV